MKQFGYVYFNKKVGAYTAPTFLVYDVELKKEMDVRAYKLCSEKERSEYEECELYYIGSFDDKTATFDLLKKPEYLLSFGGKEDGKGKAK